MSVPFNGLPSLSPIQRDFERLLHIPRQVFGQLWDKQLTIITKNIEIDIFKLDDILHERFGKYEKDNKSAMDIILEKYGEEAFNFIESLL